MTNKTDSKSETLHLWKVLSRSCQDMLAEVGAKEILAGIERFRLDSGVMPSFTEINGMLSSLGWSVVPVTGFISSKLFLGHLANRVLPVSTKMRPSRDINFSVEPDYFHEAFGHLCLLADDRLRRCLQRYGEIGLDCFSYDIDDTYLQSISDLVQDKKRDPNRRADRVEPNRDDVSEIIQLARLSWWTFETGVVRQEGGYKVWGAALISSVGEMRSYKQRPLIPFTMDCVWEQFDPTMAQDSYYYLDSLSQLEEILDQFEGAMAAKTGGLTGAKKSLKAKAESEMRLADGRVVNGFVQRIDDDTVTIGETLQGRYTLAVKAEDILGIKPRRKQSC